MWASLSWKGPEGTHSPRRAKRHCCLGQLQSTGSVHSPEDCLNIIQWEGAPWLSRGVGWGKGPAEGKDTHTSLGPDLFIKVKSSQTLMVSCVPLFATPWTVPCRSPLSMGFPRQEHWSGLPFPPPRDLPSLGIQHVSPALQADPLPLSHQGSSNPFLSPAQRSRGREVKWPATGHSMSWQENSARVLTLRITFHSSKPGLSWLCLSPGT